MIISHEEEKVVQTEVVDKTICNKCGQEIIDEEHIHISHSFGYFSNYDGEDHSMDICQKCYKEFISTFKIQPEIIDKMDWI